MKQLTLALFWCFPVFLFGQTVPVDSTFIKQVDSLLDISIALTAERKLEEAWEMGKKAEKLALDKIGKESTSYGNVCSNFGGILVSKRELSEAEKWFEESLIIRGEILGKEHADYVMMLRNIAIVNWRGGNFEKAEKYLLEFIVIRKKTLGEDHLGYAEGLANLGGLYSVMGAYEKAERCYLQAKDIREIKMEEADPYYSQTFNSLGILYKNMGEYETAEFYYLKAIGLKEKYQGKNSVSYTGAVINLGNLYIDMGNFEKAESFYLEAKEILESSPENRKHIYYMNCINNLGDLYEDLRDFSKSEFYYTKAKEIRTEALGEEHPDVAASLNNLGYLYIRMGDPEKAEPYILKACEIWKKSLSIGHPYIAGGFSLLGHIYTAKGEYEKAERFIRESMEMQEKALGREHPQFLVTLLLAAELSQEKEEYEKAEAYFQENSYSSQELILKSLRHLSIRELQKYLSIFSTNQEKILSFSQKTEGRYAATTCYDNSLFYKGFLLNTSSKVRQLISLDSISNETYDLLKSYQRRLAGEYSRPFVERDSSVIATLEEEANLLEKELARTISGFDDAVRQVKWQEVQGGLRNGEAAMEFVRYRSHNKSQTKSIYYGALILLPNSSEPKFISLFEEKQLEELLNKQKKDRAANINHIYEKKSLYELIWKPLDHELKNIKTIYYSPSGLLHRFNLNAAQNNNTSFEEQYKLVQLSSTRQLVVDRKSLVTANAPSSNALLFGGIHYDMDSTKIAAVNYTVDKTASRGSLHFSQSDSTFRNDSWSYLDWTEIEVSAIQSILKESKFSTTLWGGYKATEEAFKSITVPSPRIVHIATHGFFFPDPEAIDKKGAYINDDLIFKISDHPMIRSGLILAGANHAWKTGKPFKPDMEDGILTAYEISQMDLSSTELVVLSACDTGLGDIEGNEGVYGLQRAFKIAGGKYLIMSLWQVPDYQTQQLMTVFYNNWLTKKMSIPDAFRLAQKEMQEKYEDPFLWAGFVLVE